MTLLQMMTVRKIWTRRLTVFLDDYGRNGFEHVLDYVFSTGHSCRNRCLAISAWNIFQRPNIISITSCQVSFRYLCAEALEKESAKSALRACVDHANMDLLAKEELLEAIAASSL